MRPERSLSGDDRAVSETLGFALMFMILVASVTLVSTVGVDQLTTLRDQEQVNSADRAMQGLASTFDDVYRREDPHRSTQLAISGGTVLVRPSTLSVTVEEGGTTHLDTDVDVDALQHTINDETLTYEGGAVFRSDAGVTRWNPPITCTDEFALVNVLRLTTDESFYEASGSDRVLVPVSAQVPGEGNVGAVSDEGLIQLEVSHRATTVAYSELEQGTVPDEETVTLDVADSVRPAWWGRFLTNNGWSKTGPDTYQCQATHTYVRTVKLELGTDVQGS